MRRKLLALTMLFAALLIVPWHSLKAQTNPLYEENFDAVDAGKLPDGWTENHKKYAWSVLAPGSGHYNRGLVTSNVIGCDSYNNSDESSFTTSSFSLPASPAYVLNFDWLGDIYEDKFTVFVVENGSETELMTGNGSDNAWTSFENVSLEAYAGKTVSLKFRFKGDWGNKDVAVDNIMVSLPLTCAKSVNLNVSAVTSNSVTVTWGTQEGMTAAGDYNYVVSGAGEPVTGTILAADITVSEEGVRTATISGLQPASDYSLTLQGKCSDTEVSKVSTPVAFKTACVAVTDAESLYKVYEFKQSVAECWEIGDRSEKPSQSWSGSWYSLQIRDFMYSFYTTVDPTTVELVISAKAYSENLHVGIAYIDGDGNEQIIPCGTEMVSSEYKNYYFNFLALTAEQKTAIQGKEYRFFLSVEDYYNYVYVESVEIHACPNYMPAYGMKVTDMEKTAAKLNWTPARETDSKFKVTYTVAEMGGTGIEKTETLNGVTSLNLTGLTPLTRYKVSGNIVTMNPENESDVSRAAAFDIQFDTKGDPIVVDAGNVWVENFETGINKKNNYDMPVGWLITDNNSKAKSYLNISSGLNSSTGVQFYSEGGTQTTRDVVLPEFALTAGVTYRFSFFLSRSSGSVDEGATAADNSVYVYTSATDAIGEQTSVYNVPLHRDFEPKVTDGSFVKYYVDFTPAEDSPIKYIILRFNAGLYMRAYFDNFQLSVKPEIETIERPISATYISHDEITVGYAKAEGDDETLRLQALAVPKGKSMTDESAVISEVSTESHSITVTGLTEQTSYNIYLRVVKDGKTSLWSSYFASASTLCLPESISETDGYHNGFDDMQVEYDMSMTTSVLNTPCYFFVNPSGAPLSVIDERDNTEAEGYYLHARDYVDGDTPSRAIGRKYTSSKVGETVTYKRFNLKGGQGYKMSVYATALIIEEQQPAASFTLNMVMGDSAGLKRNTVFVSYDVPVEILNDNNLAVAWNNDPYVGYFKAPADGIYYVGIQMEGKGFDFDGFYAIDDWSIEYADYMPITADVVPAADHATFTFKDGEENDNYKLRILNRPFKLSEIENITDWTVSTDAIATVEHTTANALVENTTYYYVVARTNGEKTSVWSNPAMFTTPCFDKTVLGYTDGFAEMQEDEAPACWFPLVGNAVVGVTPATEGVKRSLVLDANGIVASPTFASTLNGYALTGKVFSFVAGTEFTVGVNTSIDFENPAIETELYNGTVFNKETWQDFTVYFVGTTAEELAEKANYFLFKAGKDQCRFADLKIIEMPTCPAMVSGEILYETVTPTTVDVKLTSTALTAPQGWILEARPVGNDAAQNITTDLITDITANAQIIGLEYVTTYTIYVKVQCGDDSDSEWIQLGDITTGCPVMTVPYTTDDLTGASVLPTCWSAETTDKFNMFAWGGEYAGYATQIFTMNSLCEDATISAELLSAEISITQSSYAEVSYYIDGDAHFNVFIIDEATGNEEELAVLGINGDFTKSFIIPDTYNGKHVRFAFRAGVNNGLNVSEDKKITLSIKSFSVKSDNVPTQAEHTLTITSDDPRFVTDTESGDMYMNLGLVYSKAAASFKIKVKGTGVSDIALSKYEYMGSTATFTPEFVPADGQEHEVTITVSDYYSYDDSEKIIISDIVSEQYIKLGYSVFQGIGLYSDEAVCDANGENCVLDLGELTVGQTALYESEEIYMYIPRTTAVINFTADNTDVTFDEATLTLNNSSVYYDALVFSVTPTGLGEHTAVITASVEEIEYTSTFTIKWTGVAAPEIVLETVEGLLDENGAVNIENIPYGKTSEFAITVKGVSMKESITVAVKGENAANLTADKTAVSAEESVEGSVVTFTVTADNLTGGSAVIEFTNADAEPLEVPVTWTVATPTIEIASEAVVEGAVNVENIIIGNTSEFTITVTGANLKDDVAVEVTGEGLAADKATVTVEEATAGATVTFTITASDKTGGSATVKFTTEGAETIEVPVTWTVKDKPVNVDNVTLNSVVYVNGGVVYVEAPEGSAIEVYSAAGQRLAATKAATDLTAINGIETGVVIVRVNGVAHKVVVK